MTTTNNALPTLKRELEFLDQGGYRTLIGRRQPLFCMETAAEWGRPSFFEDSPACPKKRYCACSAASDCVLMSFAPADKRHKEVPCHHIPLNEAGETIDSLERTSTRDKIETALRNWLVKTIGRLEEAAIR